MFGRTRAVRSGDSLSNVTPNERHQRRLSVVRAAVESLEPRWLMSAVVVNSVSDAATDATITGAAVTLREAINYTNANGGGTITFASSLAGKTITLRGAQLEVSTKSAVTIDASKIGGVYISGNNISRVLQVDAGADVTINDLKITQGRIYDDGTQPLANGGAGIRNAGTLAVVDSNILGNYTINDGGGIYTSGQLTVTDSTIANNVGFDGAGIYVDKAGSATITHTTLNGNIAYGNGAGIGSAGKLSIIESTIAGNLGGKLGGGLFASSPVSIADSTFVGNTAPTKVPNDLSTTSTVTAVNSIFADSKVKLSAASGHNLVLTGSTGGSGNVIVASAAAMGLGTLGNNGGLTQTVALLAGSAAIDTGSNTLVPAGITTDQIGKARVSDGTVDIGAVEYQFVTTVTKVSPTVASLTYGQAEAFKVTVTGTKAGSVAFYLDGSTKAFDTETISATGQATSAAISTLSAGTHTVTAKYLHSGVYATSTDTESFTVMQAKPTIALTAPGGVYTGKAFAASGTITGLNGVSLGKPTIKYYLASDTKLTKAIAAPISVGSYLAVATYAGSTNYAAATLTKAFVISAANSKASRPAIA